MKLIIISILSLLTACVNTTRQDKNISLAEIKIPDIFIESTDSSLHFDNGVYYYHQSSFSGTIIERYNDKAFHHQTSYLRGKEEGLQETYYPGGKLSEKRYYHLGEKDGVHTGWWQNGKLRFEYHFHNGQYNGNYKEWYSSGRPYKNIHYINDVDDYGIGWRENGKVFMSYVMKNGRRYGSINANLCYTLKNELGEFVTSTKISQDR